VDEEVEVARPPEAADAMTRGGSGVGGEAPLFAAMVGLGSPSDLDDAICNLLESDHHRKCIRVDVFPILKQEHEGHNKMKDSHGAHHHGPSPLAEERRMGRGMETMLRVALQATEGMTI
jgi:hypothetical protein